jgi:UDP-3-O-[3-hydroxymyristoyl] N-acetylglucosamine deacetylase/3-hydroxyacyl-[acyl-carrier-protein] dehydratase
LKAQKTILTEAKLSGRGLFDGREVKVVFRPAAADTGVVFVRTDTAEPVRVAALAPNIAERPRRTALRKGPVYVETVEHCLAALCGLGIDNVLVELDSPELPGLDSSSAEYVRVLKKAGLAEQQAQRKELVITRPIMLVDGDASVYALPAGRADMLQVTYDLDYGPHLGIGRQVFSCQVSPESFEKHLAPARTFVLEAEAKQLQARGIGTHLGPRDILVIGSDGPIRNSFRFSDECVRHKIVDLLGDLALVGRAVRGRIVAYKSGHGLNQQLARKLFALAAGQDRLARQGTDALLDIRRIQKILPHRYPFLLVDKVVEIEGDTRIKGIKNVTANEHFFQGHFPGTPVMPGVLVVEAMAQLSGLLFAQRLEHTGKLALLVAMDQVKLRRPVVPGDQLVLVAEAVRVRSRTGQCHCVAMVDERIAAEAELRFMLVDDDRV